MEGRRVLAACSALQKDVQVLALVPCSIPCTGLLPCTQACTGTGTDADTDAGTSVNGGWTDRRTMHEIAHQLRHAPLNMMAGYTLPYVWLGFPVFQIVRTIQYVRRRLGLI